MFTGPSTPTLMVPLSSEKLYQILRWRENVAETSSPYDLYALSIEPLLDPLEGFHHPDYFGFPGCSQGFGGTNAFQHHQTADMDAFDMDRYTFVFEGNNEIQNLPHPGSNPLMTTDLELLHEEYLRVLAVWNKFELEKWQAEKMLRGAATPDNVQRVFAADHAVESASAAARYIETYAKMHGIRYNFEGLFFKYYQSPADVFGLYTQGTSCSAPTTPRTTATMAATAGTPPYAAKGNNNVNVNVTPPQQLNSAWNSSFIAPQFRLSNGFGYNPPHGQLQQNMPFTACVPEWTILPAPVPSRMIEV